MKLSERAHRSVLAIALTASLLVTGWVMSRERPEAEVVVPTQRTEGPGRSSEPRGTAAVTSSTDLDLERLKREPSTGRAKAPDAFEQRSWYQPPPPPKVAPPPPPSAPPLPFAYLGKLIEGGQTTVFLSRGERTYSVTKGDTLDNVYRVEEIEPERIVLLYLPLSERQSLALGGDR